ncbi:MAG TPA: hypothetical protein VFL47_12920 [Flavisolibacter sp.]|nr:hypothetical protein [Flavisolibacter sp.]
MNHPLHSRLAIFALLLPAFLFAQKEIAVNAVTKQMSRGEQPGFQVTIPYGKLKEITTAYKKQLQENTKVDAKEVGGELVSNGAVNRNFSSKPFTVFSKFLETPEGVDMTVFVTEDSVSFISETSDADKLTALKKSIYDFAVTQYKKIVTQKWEVENDKLKQLKKDLEKKTSEESDNIKDISKKEREIESYTAKIESNKNALVSKTDQVSRQQYTVNEISDKKSPEYQLASKNLKSYQGEKKSLEKETEKMGRKIDDNRADIKELEFKNEELKKQQAALKEKIDAQEAVVKAIEEELNGIK